MFELTNYILANWVRRPVRVGLWYGLFLIPELVLSIKTSRNANELCDSASLVNWIWLWTLFKFWEENTNV